MKCNLDFPSRFEFVQRSAAQRRGECVCPGAAEEHASRATAAASHGGVSRWLVCLRFVSRRQRPRDASSKVACTASRTAASRDSMADTPTTLRREHRGLSSDTGDRPRHDGAQGSTAQHRAAARRRAESGAALSCVRIRRQAYRHAGTTTRTTGAGAASAGGGERHTAELGAVRCACVHRGGSHASHQPRGSVTQEQRTRQVPQGTRRADEAFQASATLSAAAGGAHHRDDGRVLHRRRRQRRDHEQSRHLQGSRARVIGQLASADPSHAHVDRLVLVRGACGSDLSAVPLWRGARRGHQRSSGGCERIHRREESVRGDGTRRIRRRLHSANHDSAGAQRTTRLDRVPAVVRHNTRARNKTTEGKKSNLTACSTLCAVLAAGPLPSVPCSMCPSSAAN